MTVQLRRMFKDFSGAPHELAAVDLLQEQMPASLLRSDSEWIQAFNAKVGPSVKAQPGSQSSNVTALSPVLALIRRGEGSYDSINRGRAGDTPGGKRTLPSMTLAEVQGLQAGGGAFAVGAYQFIPETLKMAMAAAGVRGSDRFSPDVQDRLAVGLIMGGKRPAAAAYFSGRSEDLDKAQADLAMEWAALPMPDGRGFYDGDRAGNKASIKSADLRHAMIQARALIAGGLPVLKIPAQQPGRIEPQYYTQRDNGPVSDRTCFSSTCAMLAKIVKPSCLMGSNADLDFLAIVNRYGDTTQSGAQLKALAHFGIRARLVQNGAPALITEQIKRWGGLAVGWIHNGPVKMPTGSGHWSLVWNETPTHLVHHDPGGEADMVRGGFVNHNRGRAVAYSKANFFKRWEVVGSDPWHYSPGHGYAVVVDSVR